MKIFYYFDRWYKYIKYLICLFLVDKLWPRKESSIIFEINHNNKNGDTFLTKIWDDCYDYVIKYENWYYKIDT